MKNDHPSFVSATMLCAFLTCISTAALADGLQLNLEYSSVTSFNDEDHARFRLLQTDENQLLSQHEVVAGPILISMNGGKARAEWSTESRATWAKPNANALAALHLMDPKLAARYDDANATMITHSAHTVIWDSEADSVLRTEMKETDAYDFNEGVRSVTTSTRQKAARSRAPACELASYNFNFHQIQSPCQTLEWIESGFIVPNGREDALTLDVRDALGGSFRITTLQCEYYDGPDNVVSDGQTGRCIAFFGQVPITLINMAEGADIPGISEGSFMRQELVRLDLHPAFEENHFDFAENQPCGPELSRAWTRC